MDARRELVIELVLRCVELVPAGRVASYGTVAAICGVGPREVGAVMQHYSDGLPWWRITSASGDFAPPLLTRALPHWADEAIAVKPSGRGCRYGEHAVDPDALRAAWRRATADLPSLHSVRHDASDP